MQAETAEPLPTTKPPAKAILAEAQRGQHRHLVIKAARLEDVEAVVAARQLRLLKADRIGAADLPLQAKDPKDREARYIAIEDGRKEPPRTTLKVVTADVFTWLVKAVETAESKAQLLIEEIEATKAKAAAEAAAEQPAAP